MMRKGLIKKILKHQDVPGTSCNRPNEGIDPRPLVPLSSGFNIATQEVEKCLFVGLFCLIPPKVSKIKPILITQLICV